MTQISFKFDTSLTHLGRKAMTTIRTITYGKRHFRAVAPALWNDLPLLIRNTETLARFKRILKTPVFIEYLYNMFGCCHSWSPE